MSDIVSYALPVLTEDDGYPRYAQLQRLKGEIVSTMRLGSALMFTIAALFDEIDSGQLYLAENNPATGRPYRSMREYLPDLLRELKEQAELHSLSERSVREYVALHKVFVKGLGVAPDDIVRNGVGHYSEARKALPYNADTGEILDEVPEGKLPAAEVLQVLQQSVDSHARVQDTRHALNTQRQVVERHLYLHWDKVSDGGFRLSSFAYSNDGVWANLTAGTLMTEEEVRWITKHAGAVSNLEPMGA